ncbi:MAG: NUDIX domain-containing protein [Bacteroidaceae bacterium]|nr:NUDIX domain-containing protein [Bacteroidaceae bacterium]
MSLDPHPLTAFRFCPHCGSAHWAVHDPYAKRCADCGFTFYANASAATVAVVRNAAGELLAVRRAHNPARGTLDLPGGFVSPGERVEEACLRELREELGVEGRIVRFLFSQPNVYPFGGFDVHTTDLFFEVQIAEGARLTPADDAASYTWLAPAHIRPADFGLPSIAQGVRRLLENI